MKIKKIIIIGGGGHAKVLIDCLQYNNKEIFGIIDPHLEKGDRINGLNVLGGDEFLDNINPNNTILVNAIGSTGKNTLRKKIFQHYKKRNFCFSQIFHPSITIASDVSFSEGTQVMAGVIIQPGVRISENTLINTKVSIDHDCYIGEHCHLAPGVTISGGVKIGNNVHIGTGSSIIEGVNIGNNVVIGAGTTIVNDIIDNHKIIGPKPKSIICKDI